MLDDYGPASVSISSLSVITDPDDGNDEGDCDFIDALSTWILWSKEQGTFHSQLCDVWDDFSLFVPRDILTLWGWLKMECDSETFLSASNKISASLKTGLAHLCANISKTHSGNDAQHSCISKLDCQVDASQVKTSDVCTCCGLCV